MAAPKKPAEPEQAPAPASEKPVPEVDRPRIIVFFERIGLVKGASYKTVVMTAAAGRSYIGPVIVEDIAAIGNPEDVLPAEIVVTFSEPGLKARHRVRYAELVSWTEAD